MPSPMEPLRIVCLLLLLHDDFIDHQKESSHGKSIHSLHIGDTQMSADIVAVLGSGGGIYISGGFVLVILFVVVVMRLLR